MNPLSLLKTKYGIGLGVAMLAVAIGIGSYKWYHRFGFTHAPDIDLTTVSDGRTLNLKQLQGKPILLTFWASNCPQCLHEIPQLKALYQELAPKGLEMVGVSVYWDKLDRLRAMVQSKNLPYPVIYDGNKTLFHAISGYGLTPTTFLINPQGHVVMKKVGEMNIPAVRKTILAMLEKK
jgi:peroxiredoxin